MTVKNNRSKKAISVIIALALMIASVPVTVYAEVTASGQCGDNAFWSYDIQTQVLTISGEGEMASDCRSEFYPLFDETYSLTSIVIEEGITNIPANTFERIYFTDVTIPSTVKSIGDYAFCECYSLTTVNFSEGLEEIGASAFNQTQINNITLPSSLTTMGRSAFSACYSLTDITIPDGVSVITTECFRDCTALTTVDLGAGVTTIDDLAFYGSGLTEITLGENVAAVNTMAFDSTALSNVYILNPFIQIEYSSQNDPNDPFPSTATVSGVSGSATEQYAAATGKAFQAIPNIGICGTSSYWKFDDTTGSLTVAGSGDIQDNTESTIPWIDIKDQITTVEIGNEITTIGENSFNGCSGLTGINIGDGVNSINSYAFAGCTSLTELTIPQNVLSIAEYAFYNTGLNKITFLSKDTIINGDAASGINTESTVIYCLMNSNAYLYAKDYNRSYVVLCTDFSESHNFSAVVNPATCTAEGYTTYTCQEADCGYEYIGDETIALGHSFTENEKYCLNNCGEENPDYKPPTEESNENDTDDIPSALPEESGSAESNQYSGSRETEYSAYRIVPCYNQIKVAWTADNKLDGYKIYISADKNGNFEYIADVKTENGSYYLINNLKSKQIYYVKIVGYLEYNNETIEMNESRTRGIMVK